jgi:hypothetical protein
MVKPVFTEEMQSAIMQASPDDAGLLSQAIISEFMGLEPVALPKHLELIMSVFRQQIKKLKESYNKKVADTRRRVERHRNKEVSEESKSADNSCNALQALQALHSEHSYTYNTKTKTKDNIKTTSYQKEKTNKKEKGLALGFGGKSPYIFSAINSTMDIFSDKPEEHIAADLCQTNSAYSINTWRKLAKRSPWIFRDEIATLYSEMTQGEIPDNPAAVLTWRVQRAYKREGIQS